MQLYNDDISDVSKATRYKTKARLSTFCHLLKIHESL